MNKLYSSALALISAMAVTGSALAGDACDGGGPGKGQRMERLDTNKDGKVTLTELTQSKQDWFARVDTNKDGVATAAELDAHRTAKHEQRVKAMFERKDENKDGSLSREESRMPERWFARADQNGDGALTPAELADRPQRGGKRGAQGKGRGGKLGHLDDNGDGQVQRAEVTQAAQRMLQRLDENSDGALTADELGARGKKGRRHHGPGRARGKASATPSAS